MPARGRVQVVQKKHTKKPAGVAGRQVRALGGAACLHEALGRIVPF